MKKFMLSLVLLVTVFTSVAGAADKAEKDENGLLRPNLGYWKKADQAGAVGISISVQLMQGDKQISSTKVTTPNGESTSLMFGEEHSYLAQALKDESGKVVLTPGKVITGMNISLTPTLTKDGKIIIAFIFNKSELTSIQTIKHDDMTIELPQVSTETLSQKVTLKNGEEVAIPFGGLVNSKLAPVRTQYTIKMIATKQ